MGRRLFAILAGVCCVFACAVAVDGFRSLRAPWDLLVGHRFDGQHSFASYFLVSSDGVFHFELEQNHFNSRPLSRPQSDWDAEDAVGIRTPALRNFGWPSYGFLGIAFLWDAAASTKGEARLFQTKVPHWFIVSLACVCPAIWLHRRLRVAQGRRRTRSGCCATCGYDLRAGHTRCPEFSTPVTCARSAAGSA